MDEVPRSRTPEPAQKRPRTKRASYSRQASGAPSAKRASRAPSDRAATDLELEQGASSDQDPQATIADPELEQGASSDQDPQATIADPYLPVHYLHPL